MSVMSFVESYDLGARTARAIKAGDEFTGAFGACVAARLSRDAAHGRLFVQGYLDSLDKIAGRGVVVDRDNRVVELRP